MEEGRRVLVLVVWNLNLTEPRFLFLCQCFIRTKIIQKKVLFCLRFNQDVRELNYGPIFKLTRPTNINLTRLLPSSYKAETWHRNILLYLKKKKCLNIIVLDSNHNAELCRQIINNSWYKIAKFYIWVKWFSCIFRDGWLCPVLFINEDL